MCKDPMELIRVGGGVEVNATTVGTAKRKSSTLSHSPLKQKLRTKLMRLNSENCRKKVRIMC